MAAEACDRCVLAWDRGLIDRGAIQPLPATAPPKGFDGGPCCHDCQAADDLTRSGGLDFDQARTAVGNERTEQYRMPFSMRAAMGLAQGRHIHVAAEDFDLDEHYEWLSDAGIPDDEDEWG